MKVRNRFAGLLAAVMALGVLALPITASAQSLSQQSANRQKQKNQWRNLALGAGAVAVYGLLNKNSTLTLGGAAGAAYSLYRCEQDRKSQASIDTRRSRAYRRYRR